MDEERSGKGLWIALFVVALIAALVFAVLWYLRGSDVDRLNSAIAANQSAADATATRLERELRTARSDVDSGNRKITELETRIRDEQRRATELTQQVERRLRGEVDSANSRVRDMTSQLAQLRQELAGKEDGIQQPEPSAETAVAGIAAGAGLVAAASSPDASVEDVKQQLADARSSAEAREKELYQRLADAVKEKEELAGTVGDLKASINNIGLELTSANEELKNTEGLRDRADSLEKDLTAARRTIEDLRKHNDELDSGHSSLKRELAAAGTAVAAAGIAAAKISDLEKKLAEAESSAAGFKADLDKANADASRSGNVESDLSSAQKRIEELSGQVAAYETEQAGLRKDLTETAQKLQKAQADAAKADALAGQLEAADKTIDEMRSRIGTLEATQVNLRKDLAAAMADLKRAETAKGDAAPVAELEHRIAAITTELEAARKQKTADDESLKKLHDDHAAQRDAAAETERTLRDRIRVLTDENSDTLKLVDELHERIEKAAPQNPALSREVNDAIDKLEAKIDTAEAPDAGLQAAQKEVETLRGQLAEATQAADALRAKNETEAQSNKQALADANATIAKLNEKIGDIEANNSSLRKELNSAADDLRALQESSGKELDAAKKNYEKLLADERARQTQREKDLQAAFEREKEAWNKRAEEVKAAKEESPAVPPVSETPAGASGLLAEAPAVPAEPAAPANIIDLPVEPTHYFVRDPERAAGNVLDLAANGRYVVNVGTRQGVKPGMIFDVHRPLGGMNWFIGTLLIEKAMNDTSEALTVPVQGVKICPVSGRAVLDPDSKYSPFVYADGGKPVPLIPAESLGLGGELPSSGDRIDNPFFDPSRQLLFAVSPEVKGSAPALTSIKALGGTIQAEGDVNSDADYLVVDTEKPENAESMPRRVTPGQLASYAAP